MNKWSIHSDVVKYVQYDQYPVGHCKLGIKAPEETYGTKMYRRLQKSKREVKEMNFSSIERLK